MSTENEDQCFLAQSKFHETTQKRSKITYTRDFLLSFTELNICKELPSGAEVPIFRVSGDASNGKLEMQKTPGNVLPRYTWGSQYGSSSSTGWDSGDCSRGLGGLNNRDDHLQGNRDSDIGRHYGGQSQHSRQSPGHNGLLGCCTSPKVFGCTATASTPMVQETAYYLLSKSDNPYRPPHSYKAAPMSGREAEEDSYTKEASSSAENVNDERTEEEKMRSSFQLIREKEHKAFQEKQKQIGDKLFSEVVSDSSWPNISRKENNGNSEKCETLEISFGIGLEKDFESNEVSISVQRGLVDRISGTDISKPGGFAFLVIDDNSLTSIADEYQSVGTNYEGIRVANSAEITELDKTDVNRSSFDDDWAEIVSILRMEQELDLSPVAGCDQMSDSTVQFCLPDEDSLIAVDDPIISLQSKFMSEIAPNLQIEQESKLSPVAGSGCDESPFEYCLPDDESLISFDDLMIPNYSLSLSGGNSVKDDMLTSNVKADQPDKFGSPNVVPWEGWDERSTVPGFYGVRSPGNSYHNQHSQQSYPQFCNSQVNPGRPSFHALDSHQVRMSSQTKFMDPKTTYHTLHPNHHFNVHSCPSIRTPSEQKRSHPPVHNSLLRQPIVFPPLQHNEMVRAPAAPALPNHMNQMTFHAQVLNPMQTFPSNYRQLNYESSGMPNPDAGGAALYNDQVSYKHSSAIAGSIRDTCSKQLGPGFWYGH